MRPARRLIFYALLIGAVGGCTEASSTDPTSPKRHGEARQAAVVASAGDEDPTDKLLPDEQVQTIDWEASNAYRQLPEDAVPNHLREAYAESPVPVLLPKDPALLEATFPTTGEHWYAAAIHHDGVGINIQGSRVARKMPDLGVSDSGEALVDGRFLLSRTHGIVSLAFTDFGVAYDIEIECRRPSADRRCAENDYAIEIAEQLAVLGGDR